MFRPTADCQCNSFDKSWTKKNVSGDGCLPTQQLQAVASQKYYFFPKICLKSAFFGLKVVLLPLVALIATPHTYLHMLSIRKHGWFIAATTVSRLPAPKMANAKLDGNCHFFWLKNGVV